MRAAAERRTVILGLGNPVLSDDRVGLAVAEAVKRHLLQRPLAGVEVAMASRGGFHLIDLLQGCERAVLIDCYAPPNAVPGIVRRLELPLVAGAARLVGAHDISIGEAFQFAALLSIPMPAEVTIYAVAGADTETLSERMTPSVEAAVEPLARRIYATLGGERPKGRCSGTP